jgi:multiple sugar transport system ATP-binding protein
MALPVERGIDGTALRLGDGAAATLVPASAAAIGTRDRVILGIRPEDLRLGPADPRGPALRPGEVRFEGTVIIAEPLGTATQVTFRAHGHELVGMADGRLLPSGGETVAVTIDISLVHLFDPEGARLGA